MKEKLPVTVLLSRIRREIVYLKAVLRENGIVIPKPLADLLATQLPKRIDAKDRRRLRLAREQERELRALRDKTCPTQHFIARQANLPKKRGADFRGQ